MRIESKLRIAGVPTEHWFFLDAWFKRNLMFDWYPCDSEHGFNPQAKNWFFEYGSEKNAYYFGKYKTSKYCCCAISV